MNSEAEIDGDIVLYSCGFVAEKKQYSVYIGDEETKFDNRKDALEWLGDQQGELVVTTKVEPLAFSLHAINTLLARIMERTGANRCNIFLTGKDNFRDKLVDYYKKNRDPEAKPVHYDECKKFLINRHNAIVVDGMEADDAMGIAQWNAPTDSTCICTIDKDLDMIPGWHYNWQKDSRYYVDGDEAIRWFYTQMITGDKSVDNIPGLYHITGKKASKTIKDGLLGCDTEWEMWDYVSGLYEANGGTVDQVIEIARLLWIKRTEDEALWEPPSDPSIPNVGLAPGTQEHPEVPTPS